MHPKFSSLTPPLNFRILKNGIYVKALFIKKLQTKFHQNRTRNNRSYSNFMNGVKIAKFSEFFASRTPEIGRLVLEI